LELYFSIDNSKSYVVQQNRIQNIPEATIGDMSEGLYWSAKLNTLSPAVTQKLIM
jgi:hypothetical protein